MSGLKKVESRVRYSYWDLLGDVGGFNDGLFLLGSILLKTYAGLAFKEDYLIGTEFESPKSRSVRSLENSEGYKSILSSIEAG